MKRSMGLICVITMVFGFIFLGCDLGNTNQNQSGGDEQKQTETEQQQEETAPIPDIKSGEYMVSGTNPNVVIKVNKEDGLITITEFSDFDGYLRLGTDKALLGDVVSSASSSTYEKYGTSSEYKIPFKGETYYFYKSGSDYRLSKNHTSSSLCIFITDEIKKEWAKPADGTYVSAKITVDNQDKYVYAVVSDSSQTIKIYLESSAGLKDFSALTVYGIIQNPEYEFIPHELICQKDGWKILCNSKFFKLSKDGVFDSTKLTLGE